jgi:hypothetical protein
VEAVIEDNKAARSRLSGVKIGIDGILQNELGEGEVA